MTSSTDRRSPTSSRPGFGRLSIAISALAIATALVHLYLGVFTTMLVVGDPAQAAALGGTTMLSVMVGYVVLGGTLYLPALARYRRLARWGLITWAAGNLVAYVVLAHANVDAFGVADKVCELLLIALLVIEDRRERV